MKLIINTAEINISNSAAAWTPTVTGATMAEVAAEIDKIPANYAGTVLFRDDTTDDIRIEDCIVSRDSVRFAYTETGAIASIPLRAMTEEEKWKRDLQEIVDALVLESLLNA